MSSRSPTRRRRRSAVAAAVLALELAGQGVAHADDAEIRAVDPSRVTGVVRPEVKPDDVNRALASTIFFLPRETVNLLFLASGVTAGLIRDEQVVPRVGELFSPKPGEISLFPSLLFDTRRRVSIGGQMITSGESSGTRIAAGFGGIHDIVGEARMRFNFGVRHPFILSLEGMADTRSHLEYLGIGQDPAFDTRNRFRRGIPFSSAFYSESRSRFILGVGYRASRNLELLFSNSVTRSTVDDPPDRDPAAISRVFETGSVLGGPRCPEAFSLRYCPVQTQILFSEVATRLDTRKSVAMPSSGFLLEGYAGLGSGAGDIPTRFVRVGGRAAAFIPLVRKSTILSPRIILDGIAPLDGFPMPFTALVNQPDFRSIDNRIDHVSMVASLDYRWSIIRYIGARVFMDFATVAPNAKALFMVGPRPAFGVEMDVYSNSTELAQFVLSVSKEGPVAYMAIGVPSLFGDRQHRH